MNQRPFVTSSQEETEALGRRFGSNLTAPTTILLEGSLGAGKTALTRGIVTGFGCTDPTLVHSPTFSLINEYHCPTGTVYHIDLYRLDTLRELYSIGLDELVTSNAIIIVEWSEKLLFKVDHTWRIRLEIAGPDTRVITIEEKVEG